MTIGGVYTMLMVLDTGSPVSVLMSSLAQELQTRGLLYPAQTPNHYLLSELRLAGVADPRSLPSPPMRVLPRLTRLQIDGPLGLDFFRQFGRVCFHLSTLRLELTY